MASTSRTRRGRSAAKRTAKTHAREDARKAPRKASRKTAARSTTEAALAVFAHEVRTPLTGILAIADLLATSNLGERERGWVETIKASAEHLAGLATLFVDAARGGRASDIRRDLFDLRALARRAGDSLVGRAAAKGLRCDIALSDKLPGFVLGDPIRLRAALENLIDNAVKFTDSGRIGLKVSAKRGAKGTVGVVFAFSDSGIGLTLAEIKRLFRPFSQANVGIAARFGGAGLGLSSVRQMAIVMGGDVKVTRQRRGSTFALSVVLTPAQAPGAAVDAENLDRARALHVVSVEDNPFGRVVLNALLTELGHRVEFLGDGEAAIVRAQAGGFDAMLMDMVLPGIDGVETIRRIRSLDAPYGQVPIIGLSGRGADEAAARAAGADGFLVKPVSPRALATALLEATRRAAAAT